MSVSDWEYELDLKFAQDQYEDQWKELINLPRNEIPIPAPVDAEYLSDSTVIVSDWDSDGSFARTFRSVPPKEIPIPEPETEDDEENKQPQAEEKAAVEPHDPDSDVYEVYPPHEFYPPPRPAAEDLKEDGEDRKEEAEEHELVHSDLSDEYEFYAPPRPLNDPVAVVVRDEEFKVVPEEDMRAGNEEERNETRLFRIRRRLEQRQRRADKEAAREMKRKRTRRARAIQNAIVVSD